MSFFRKLQDRLFRSSSRLDAGIDEIVAGTGDDGEDESRDDDGSREAAGEESAGLIGRIAETVGAGALVSGRRLDDEMLEDLEDLLVASDMGVDLASRVTTRVAEQKFGQRVTADGIKRLLATEIAGILEPVARPIPLYADGLQVILIVGVNGSGKTTTIGKLASQFADAGKKVTIVAGDTFRAAAVEQLEIWGKRAGVPVLKAAEGTDPAALSYKAMETAGQDGTDIMLVDTAGRLQNRKDLMEELAKIVRVLKRHNEKAPHNTLLILDATTGQNAVSQVEAFREIAEISGLIMTKLDGTAKGGILAALASRFGLPIHAIGVGEKIDDLSPFDPDEFARALTGSG